MINDILKQGQNTPSTAVTLSTLQAALAELLGISQGTGIIAPSSTFPAGVTATGTVPMVVAVDIVSLSSPAGATPALKSFALPAATLSVIGMRGVRIRAWGTLANNANAKTILIKFGATTLITVTGTASTTNTWHIDAVVYVRTAVTQIAHAFGAQGPGTPTFVTLDSTPGETLSGAISIACSGTQTAAADIIQDGLTVDLIP